MPVAEKFVVGNLAAALAERAFPTITTWNRLEGRPRRGDFDRALKAEVRDAAWMLARQWQIGEFKGEDAGSPISAKVRMRTGPVTKYQPGGAATVPFTGAVPLEAQAEQRHIVWTSDGHKLHLDLRAQVGRQWLRLLGTAGLGTYDGAYRTRYPFTLPAPGTADDSIFAHRGAWQRFAALAGRAIDGGDLLAALGNGTLASDGIAGPAGELAQLDALGGELAAWFSRLYLVPVQEAAWKPEYLEYQFACSAPQAGREIVLTAGEYAQGHLDWYSFDRTATGGGLGGPPGTANEQVTVRPFLPAPVEFEGMPDARWWSLEDRKTDFGAVKPSTTDLAQLLLMEFALVYANDWFLLPFRIPAATLARIEGMAVTNTFGERFWIRASGAGTEDNWHRWAVFQLDAPGARTADTSLFIPPATSHTIDGDPLEEIELGRDEVANMVWAVERTVPSVTGAGRAGKDEARETRQYYERLVAENPAAPVPRAPISYLAMTDVPEHWIPFLPVHVPGSLREIQLQRGRMLRIITGDRNPPLKVSPRTSLVREGLDVTPKRPYFVHEEEVPRAGITVTQGFRRTRWTNGEAYVWLGVRKRTGRGERGSGLAFDALVDNVLR